jgi:hypothetical protein
MDKSRSGLSLCVSPNGEHSAVVMVIGAQDKFGWGIAMPSAAKFRAMDTLGRPHRYETSALNGAVADAHGNVDLPDGSYVHSVELEPTRLNHERTPVQKAILHHVIRYLKAEDDCYPYVDNQLLPGFRALDFAAVAKLKVGRRQSRIVRYGGEKYLCRAQRSQVRLPARAFLRRILGNAQPESRLSGCRAPPERRS